MLKAHRDELPARFAEVADAFRKAVAFLASEVGALHARVVPYGLQLVFLTTFFHATPAPTPAQVGRLVEWFWASSFAASYGGAGALGIEAHIERARRLSAGEDLAILPVRPTLEPIPRRFHPRSARVRAWHLVLAARSPRDLVTGAPLAHPLEGGLEDARAIGEGEDVWRLGGRLLVGRACQNPLEALLAAGCGPDREAVLTSHGVSDAAFRSLEEGDIDAFIRDRFELLAADEAVFARRYVEVPVSQEQLEDGELDADLMES